MLILNLLCIFVGSYKLIFPLDIAGLQELSPFFVILIQVTSVHWLHMITFSKKMCLLFFLKHSKLSVSSGSDAIFESPLHFYRFIQIGFPSGYSRTAGSFTIFRHSHSGNKCSLASFDYFQQTDVFAFLFEAF
jgi:hypothetical protein